MKRLTKIIFLILLFYCPSICLYASSILPEKVINIIMSQVKDTEGDKEFAVNKDTFIATFVNHKPVAIRKSVFKDQQLRKDFDSELLLFVEEGVAFKILGIRSERFLDLKLEKGKWDYLNDIIQNDRFSMTIENSNCTLCVPCRSGECILNFPIEYDKIKGLNRSGLESKFIEGLKAYEITNRNKPNYSIDELEKIGENLYLKRGAAYLINDVNKFSYLEKDDMGNLNFVFNPKQPAATIANMVNVGVGYKAQIGIVFSLHEYGKTDTACVSLETLIQYCISQGCEVYWGLGSIIDSTMKGTIFFHNPIQGFEHVVRVKFDYSKLGEEALLMKGRASLYIPTNNIQNLFQQYIPKKEHEKIQYK